MEEVKHKGHSKTQPANCLECDKVFAANIKEVKRGHARFCSIGCSTTHFNKQRFIAEPNCSCINCDIALYRKPCRLDKGKMVFCSHDCHNDWRRANKMSWSNNRPSTWKRLALLIKAERGNKCEECGWAEANCDVAHIIPRSQGGSDTRENALVLCPNHHRILDSGKPLKLTSGSNNIEIPYEIGGANIEWEKAYTQKKAPVE